MQVSLDVSSGSRIDQVGSDGDVVEVRSDDQGTSAELEEARELATEVSFVLEPW